MKHIKKALSYTVAGSIGLTVIASLQGCGDQSAVDRNAGGFGSSTEADITQNFFMVIEQTGTAPDVYKVVEKHPTDGPTRAILREVDGSERFMSPEELQQLAQQEAAKVEAGTSRLTEDPAMHGAGLSLGETILAAAAGSLIGGMLANRLMSNPNFQRTQQSYGGGRPTAAISRPAGKQASGQQARRGFFGGQKSGSSSPRSGFFGG